MKDFLGVEMSPGDEVVTIRPNHTAPGGYLVRAEVVGFTPKLVRLSDPKKGTVSATFLRPPEKIVRINGADTE